jgi:hypothetical protein
LQTDTEVNERAEAVERRQAEKKYRYTWFKHIGATGTHAGLDVPEQRVGTIEEVFPRHTFHEKRPEPLVAPYVLEGTRKLKEEVISTWAVMFDVDRYCDTPEQLTSFASDVERSRAGLREAGVEFVFYTSFNHGRPKKGHDHYAGYRLVIVVEELTGADLVRRYRDLWHALKKRFQISADFRAVSQAWYPPTCPHNSFSDWEHNKGTPVVLQDFLRVEEPSGERAAHSGSSSDAPTMALEWPADAETLEVARADIWSKHPPTCDGGKHGGKGRKDTIFDASCRALYGWQLPAKDAWNIIEDIDKACEPPLGQASDDERTARDEFEKALARTPSYWTGPDFRSLYEIRTWVEGQTGRPSPGTGLDFDGDEGDDERDYPEMADAPGTWAYELAKAHRDIELRNKGGGEKVRFEFVNAASIWGRAFPETSWILGGVIAEQSVVLVSGAPKTSKSWVALEIAVALSSGTRAFGKLWTPKDGRSTALFMVEDALVDVRRRLGALARGRDIKPEDALKRISLLSRGRLNLQEPEDLASLIATLRMLPEVPALLVLDPFIHLHSADENSATEMAPVMDALRTVRDVLGCSVLVVHHSSKASKENSGRTGGQKARGSSAIHGAVDGGFYMGLDSKTENTWINDVETETKSGRCAGDFKLKLEVEDESTGEVEGEFGPIRMAKVAKWEVTRETKEEGKRREAREAASKVTALLKEEYLKRPEDPKPLARETIRDRLGMGANPARVATDLAEVLGNIEQKMAGNRPMGWVWIPEADSKSQPD